MDDGPLRMHCLRFAEGSAEVRRLYKEQRLSAPEVHFELATLWPQPHAEKRRRLG